MNTITIIGSGVIGQATGQGLLEMGHKVIFCDVDFNIIKKLQKKGLRASACSSINVDDSGAFFISVPTPTINKKIELGPLKSAAKSLGQRLKNAKKYHNIVVRSTVVPGTTEEIIIPILEKYSGKKAGKDFGVCMNPEYLREVSAAEDFLNPHLITIGALDKKSYDNLAEIYKPLSKAKKVPVERLSLKEAEMMKYINNLYNAAKISFFNEMRIFSEMLKVDADKIFKMAVQTAEASWNPTYGTKNLGPFGGACLPKDTQAFATWVKSKFKKKAYLLENVIKVNEIVENKKK